MKNSYYFSHDYHARHDPKLSALIKNYGMEGYGVYWDIVEVLHEQGGKLEKFPKLYEGLSHELNINEATLKQIISASISDFGLFREDDTHIWSDRVLDNLVELDRKRTQRVDAGRLGGIISGQKRSKTKQNEATLEANEQKESKVKESKEDKDIGARFNEFWAAYPKPIGQSMAFIIFRATIKTDKDFQDLKTALKNYLASEEVKKGMVMNGSNWIEDWRGWLIMTPKKADPLDKWIAKEKR
jgi:hypothetical protein